LSRQKLIKQLKEKNPELTETESITIINVFSDSVINALKKGKAVEIRNWGRLYCRKIRENFNSRNPATNELIYKPERVRLRFRASKKLNKIINE
jgi:nucleoid DNA-binding protein